MRPLLLIILLTNLVYSAIAAPAIPEKAAGMSIQDTRIVIYPNPATDRIYIKGASAAHVEMMNMLGEVVLNEEIANSTIAVADLKAGMYIVRVYDADGSLILSSKLTKQ